MEPTVSQEGAELVASPRRRKHKDPQALLAFRIENLEEVLPFERKTIKELIELGLFPDGFRPAPDAQKVWTRKVIESYLDMLGAEAAAALPNIARSLRRLAETRGA